MQLPFKVSTARRVLLALASASQAATAGAQTAQSTAFPLQVDVFRAAPGPTRVAAGAERILSGGRHPDGLRIGRYLSMVADGSGLSAVASPNRADYGMVVQAEKTGFGGATPPTVGEVDGLLVNVFQDDGDANVFSGNGIIVDRGAGDPAKLSGYLSLFEGQAYSVLPGATSYNHHVNVQYGIVNPQRGDYVGYYTNRRIGSGGDAFVAEDFGPSRWTHGLRISSNGRNQLVQTVADASLGFTDVSGSSTVKVLNNGSALEVQGGLLVTGAFHEAAGWSAFTPTVTPASGAFGAAPIAQARYKVVDRVCTFWAEVAIADNGSAGGGITLSGLPAAASGVGARTSIISGRENQTTGSMLQGLVLNSTIRVVTYNNQHPVGASGTIILTGSYEVS